VIIRPVPATKCILQKSGTGTVSGTDTAPESHKRAAVSLHRWFVALESMSNSSGSVGRESVHFPRLYVLQRLITFNTDYKHSDAI
jgi:hypothetical protein